MVSSVLSAATSQPFTAGSTLHGSLGGGRAEQAPARVTPSDSVGVALRVERGKLPLSGLSLHHGGHLGGAQVPHETPTLAWERISPVADEGAPTVIVLGGISAGRHVADSDRRGWWRNLVGPGSAIDLERYAVLSFDYLGGNGESSGPGSSGEWPAVDVRDQARALSFLLDALGIAHPLALVGASYGGSVALAVGELYERRVQRLVVISSADRAHPQTTAYRTLQRRVVREALTRGEGPEGLRLARGLAMIGYRTAEEFAERFSGEPKTEGGRYRFPVEGYLEACGDRFASSFDPLAFLTLSESLDLHRVDPSKIEVPTHLVAVTSDQIVPFGGIEELSSQIAGPTWLHSLDSAFGHDAFLKETERVGSILRSCLGED